MGVSKQPILSVPSSFPLKCYNRTRESATHWSSGGRKRGNSVRVREKVCWVWVSFIIKSYWGTLSQVFIDLQRGEGGLSRWRETYLLSGQRRKIKSQQA